MRVYQQASELNRQLARVAVRGERTDRDLVRQRRRAASSVALNIAEGMGSCGGNRELRFQTALGSAREVMACLEVAEAWGYVGPGESSEKAAVNYVVAMLCTLLRKRR